MDVNDCEALVEAMECGLPLVWVKLPLYGGALVCAVLATNHFIDMFERADAS